MKRIFILILTSLLLLTACAKQDPADQGTARTEDAPAAQEPTEQGTVPQTENTAAEAGPTEEDEAVYKSAGDFGTVPEELKKVIEGDLFGANTGSKTVFSPGGENDVDIIGMAVNTDEESKITVRNSFGELLAEHRVEMDEFHSVCLVTPTSDGGFVYVLGFGERQLPDGSWASDYGVCSTVVKCGSDGQIRWQREYDRLSGNAFERMIELNGAYYFFGEYSDEPRDSYDHIILLKIDENGNELAKRTIKGEDFDNLQRVDRNENGFTLNIRSQSRSGDFFPIEGETEEPHMHYGRCFIAEINDELELTEMRLGGEDYVGWDMHPTGVVNGADVYSHIAGLDFPGTANLVLNCGGRILVVSSHATGIYEHTPPYVNSIWCYSETVYSVFDGDGQLVCRRCFDSTPDYEAIIASWGGN